jgi:hypothetical protein
MRSTKALLAGLGTSALLVACFVTMLTVVGAVVAFRGFPGPRLDTPAETVVVRLANSKLADVRLTREDVAAAAAADEPPAPAPAAPIPPASSAPSGTPAPSAAPQPGSPPSPDRSQPGGNGASDTAADATGGGDGVLEQVRGAPGVVRESVDALELGKNGRGVARVLSDDVVGKVSPKAGEALKKTTEPLWKTLDRVKVP